jgi:hypothetical protein
VYVNWGKIGVEDEIVVEDENEEVDVYKVDVYKVDRYTHYENCGYYCVGYCYEKEMKNGSGLKSWTRTEEVV